MSLGSPISGEPDTPSAIKAAPEVPSDQTESAIGIAVTVGLVDFGPSMASATSYLQPQVKKIGAQQSSDWLYALPVG
jgi:hypothetical protein